MVGAMQRRCSTHGSASSPGRRCARTAGGRSRCLVPAVAAVALLAVAPPAAIAGGAAPAVAVAGHSARDWLFAALASLLILALLAALAALGRTRRRLPQAPSGLPALPPGTPQDERARRLREGADHHGRPWRQLGELLRERGALSPGRLRLALETQERTGGRLGEILVAAGAVAAADVTDALGRQLELPAVAPGAEPLALLSAPEAHALRAVALKPDDACPSAPLPVAVADPGVPALASLEGWLGRPVELRLRRRGRARPPARERVRGGRDRRGHARAPRGGAASSRPTGCGCRRRRSRCSARSASSCSPGC